MKMVCQTKTGSNLAAIEPDRDLGQYISTIVSRIENKSKHKNVGQTVNRSNLITISPIDKVSTKAPVSK